MAIVRLEQQDQLAEVVPTLMALILLCSMSM